MELAKGKTWKPVGLTGAVWLGWMLEPTRAAACELCWGARGDDPTVHAISLAMLVLIGMTGIVGGGISAFFLNARRRSKLLEPGDLVITEEGEILDSHTPD